MKRPNGYVPHGIETVPVQVWIDVDPGIAELVKYLNTIPTVRTLASCQGTLGEGGAEPYGPYVMVTCKDKNTLARLQNEFDISEMHYPLCMVHPRKSSEAALSRAASSGAGATGQGEGVKATG